MSNKAITIPLTLYNRLGLHAKGFETPANVIQRLVAHYEEIHKVEERGGDTIELVPAKKDRTKYVFEEREYGKSRLVLAVVSKYVLDNPDINMKELESVFPKELQGSIGVFNELESVQKRYANKNNKRHFVKLQEVITLSDCKIAVCTEWGAGNIDGFLKRVDEMGYAVEKKLNQSKRGEV